MVWIDGWMEVQLWVHVKIIISWDIVWYVLMNLNLLISFSIVFYWRIFGRLTVEPWVPITAQTSNPMKEEVTERFVYLCEEERASKTFSLVSHEFTTLRLKMLTAFPFCVSHTLAFFVRAACRPMALCRLPPNPPGWHKERQYGRQNALWYLTWTRTWWIWCNLGSCWVLSLWCPSQRTCKSAESDKTCVCISSDGHLCRKIKHQGQCWTCESTRQRVTLQLLLMCVFKLGTHARGVCVCVC